jgi:hypothetical protein
MVEYPTLKFSNIAAGMIRTKVIQLQLLRNHPSLSEKFNINISTIERRPQGNSKKVEGLPSFGVVGMVEKFKER